MKSCPFHQGKVDSLFVVVGGNRICHGCVFGVTIFVIVMNIRLVFYVGVTALLFILFIRK